MSSSFLTPYRHHLSDGATYIIVFGLLQTYLNQDIPLSLPNLVLYVHFYYQWMMNSIAIVSGGGVRVGLEDNIWFDTARTRLATNSDFLLHIHRLAEATGRRVMSPGKLRELLNLQSGYGKYGLRDERRQRPSYKQFFLPAFLIAYQN